MILSTCFITLKRFKMLILFTTKHGTPQNIFLNIVTPKEKTLKIMKLKNQN